MIALLCGLVVLQGNQPVVRDEYGVPHIKAASADQAWYQAGYATAQDRLWQMEQSRRLARGRMAEVFGKAFAASDIDILKSGYTDEELQAQFRALPADVQGAIEAYSRGVNAYVAAAALPKGYADNGFKPEPWTPLDTTAITVRLFQQFGRGGAGEIRNMALIGYLQGRAETKNRLLDVLDDFAWQNDPAATPTIAPEEDPTLKNHPDIAKFTRADTVKHLAMLPKLSVFELLPGIRLASNEDSKLIAEQVSAPFKWGSYAVVVSAKRSTTGSPILLSAPQMGHRQPSILHEMSIDYPGLSVVGVDVPGVPGVIIGKTQFVAWGLTSGVADTDDIIFSHTDGADGYTYGAQHLKLDRISRTLHIKGEPDQVVVQTRTRFGPVVVSNKDWLLSRRSSYWMREMQASVSIFNLYKAKTVQQIDAATQNSPMSFNFFWATKHDIGYRYAGAVPIRAAGLDPRLPTPGEPQYEWKGFLTPGQMPHVINPRSGLLANWNNKPAAWWPNLDTPVWGRIFRNTAVLQAVNKPKISTADVAAVPQNIAQDDFVWPYLKPFVDGVATDPPGEDPSSPYKPVLAVLKGYHGNLEAGKPGGAVSGAFLEGLQDQLFLPTVGNLMSMDNFRQAAQPTLVWNALMGKTKVDYLNGRPRNLVVGNAMSAAADKLAHSDHASTWAYTPPAIRWGQEPPVPYSNRGTMIQVIDLRTMSGRNIVPPGVAETGSHAYDQVPLARAWKLKAMRTRG